MNEDGRAAAGSRERRLSSAVFQWATGRADADAGRVALSASRDVLADVLSQDGIADVYLVPDDDASRRATDVAQVLTFDGPFARPGDVMHIGSGYEIELKDYLAVPFTPITRPTIISCTTSAAWQAFIEDADEALATGVFIPQLASPSAVLADQSVIDAAIDDTAVAINRLTIDAKHGVRYRPGGPVIGSTRSIDLDDQPVPAFLRAEGERRDAGDAPARELAARPWIRRYLAALRIVGGTAGETWSFSGFGADLTGDAVDRRRRASGHLIAWRGEDYQLIAESGRRFALGRETAIAIESLLESPSIEQALDSVRAAGVTRPRLRQELDELSIRLAAAGVMSDLRDASASR